MTSDSLNDDVQICASLEQSMRSVNDCWNHPGVVARDGGQDWNLGEKGRNNFRRISLILYSGSAGSILP